MVVRLSLKYVHRYLLRQEIITRCHQNIRPPTRNRRKLRLLGFLGGHGWRLQNRGCGRLGCLLGLLRDRVGRLERVVELPVLRLVNLPHHHLVLIGSGVHIGFFRAVGVVVAFSLDFPGALQKGWQRLKFYQITSFLFICYNSVQNHLDRWEASFKRDSMRDDGKRQGRAVRVDQRYLVLVFVLVGR